MLLRSRVPVRGLALALASTLALPFAFTAGGAGCGSRTACFAFTQGEYAQNGDACPSPSEALMSFTDPTCPGPVVSVDGPGSFDGELCCYPVTEDGITPDCGNNGGTGGATSSGTGPLPPTGGDTSTSSGGFCLPTCAMVLANGGQACGGTSQSDLFALLSCTDASCAMECPSFLAGGIEGADSTCTPCLDASCSTQLAACQAN